MRFGEYLEQALKLKGLSQRAFSLLVGYPQQAVNGIIRGERVPPLGRLEAWANALSNHVDKALFLELGRLEHSPKEIRQLVIDLRCEISRLKTNADS